MSEKRIQKINSLMQQEISDILTNELNDPRVKRHMISVMRVLTTPDLRYAKVYISVFGDQGNEDQCIDALNHSKNFIQKILRERIRIKFIPELNFIRDTSIDHAMKIESIFKSIRENERNRKDT